MFLIETTIRNMLVPMMNVVPFVRHVTSHKTYDFCMFSKFVNFVPIDLKIGTHIDRTYTMYLAKYTLIQIT